MILDELFGPPISTVKKIVRKNGQLKVVAKPALQNATGLRTTKVFFPISKERK